MREAIALAVQNVQTNQGEPFGSVIVKAGRVIAAAANQVQSTTDPTAHAEIVAIREACRVLNTVELDGCDLYTSCEPCPMCLATIYWTKIDRVYYASTLEDAAKIGFDDRAIYQELAKPIGDRQLPMLSLLRAEARAAFQAWVLEHPEA